MLLFTHLTNHVGQGLGSFTRPHPPPRAAGLGSAPWPSLLRRGVDLLSDFTTGDIVECVDDTPHRPESRIMPMLGGLYTVTSIRPVVDGHSVRLQELTPSCHLGGVCACGECGWDAGRFRKVYRPKPGLFARFVCDVPQMA